MRERSGHSIGSVRRLWRSFQAKQPRDHELHLFLCCRTSAHHRLLDFRRRIFGDLQPGVRSSKKDYAACMAEHDRRADISGVKHILDRQCVGAMSGDQLANARMNFLQPQCERIPWLRANDPTFNERWRKHPLALHYAVAGNGCAGIDPENDQVFSSMSQLAATFWTSSRSSSSSSSFTSDSAVGPATETRFFGT